MELTFQVTRQIPGNREPVLNGIIEVNDVRLNSAVLHMSFRPEMVMGRINYRFSGEATLSFVSDFFNDEHCNFRGSICSFPHATLYVGYVTFSSLVLGSTLDEGLLCMILGQIRFPGPQLYPFPLLLSDIQAILPTPQQTHHTLMLCVRGRMLFEAAVTLILAQEEWP